MTDGDLNSLTEKIIGAAYQVANTLGVGFLEKVYENALAHELQLNGISVEQQVPIPVSYKGAIVGDYVADLLVEGCVLVEIKATKDHSEVFTAQCLNYLRATGRPVCLLINFGNSRVDVRRFRPPSPNSHQ